MNLLPNRESEKESNYTILEQPGTHSIRQSNGVDHDDILLQ